MSPVRVLLVSWVVVGCRVSTPMASLPSEPASVPEPMPPAEAASPVSPALTELEECDFFLDRYGACVDTLSGEEAEQGRRALQLVTEHFVHRAATNPEAARVECAHSVIEQRKHRTGDECDWSGGPRMEELAAQWVPPSDDISEPGVHVLDISVHGLDGDIARAMIRAQRGTVGTCFEPSFAGRVGVSMKLNSQGYVSEISAEASSLPSTTLQCIEDGAKRWRFPKPRSGAATIESTLQVVPGQAR